MPDSKQKTLLTTLTAKFLLDSLKLKDFTNKMNSFNE